MKLKKVILVGAGPGDPKLLTLRAKECISQADVIIYDYLVNNRILRHAREDAELIYVGKKADQHTLEQPEINKLLIEKAREGKVVVRLKGGDPFVFGRGGEECIALAEEGIAFQVIPGVTAAIAAAGYAGIPVTHRGITSTLLLATGHEDPTKDTTGAPHAEINWRYLANAAGTIVFYMGVKNLSMLAAQLMKYGRSPDTPAALIQWGTTPHQRTLVGTLSDIGQKAVKTNFRPPAIIIVGEVINLRKQLSWFEQSPLFGKRIIVTRSRSQASILVDMLEELGADVIEYPTIKTVEPESFEELDKAIENIRNRRQNGQPFYDWLIFTSVNGVGFFFQRLKKKGLDGRTLFGMKICAIGPATANGLARYGLEPDCQPQKYIAESVLDELARRDNLAQRRILLARAAKTRDFLPDNLAKLGAVVHTVYTYQTIPAGEMAGEVLSLLRAGEVDLITFTSSSTAVNFVDAVGKDILAQLDKQIAYASIGPITTSTAEKLELPVSIEAKVYTIPGLVDAIVEFFG